MLNASTASRGDLFSWAAEDSPSAWQLLHLVSTDSRGRRSNAVAVTATLILANLAAWHVEYDALIRDCRPLEGGPGSGRYIPTYCFLPGIAAALEYSGVPIRRVRRGEKEGLAFCVTDIERTFAIDLKSADAFCPTRLQRRCEIPVPKLLEAIGIVMGELKLPKPGCRLALLSQEYLELRMLPWDPVLRLMGLTTQAFVAIVAGEVHLRETMPPAIAAPAALPSPVPPSPAPPRSRHHVSSVVADPAAMRQAAANVPNDRGRWADVMKKFADAGCRIQQRRVQPKDIQACRQLVARFPNFGEAIEAIVTRLQLQLHCRVPPKLPPLLLVGPPGTGKTAFAAAVATALGGKSMMIPLQQTTASFAIAGSHPSWSSARPGSMATLMLCRDHDGAQLVTLDEIDKTHGGVHPVEPALLSLLDSSSAARFRDEFLQTELDLTPLSIIATANTLEPIGAPLRSRLQPIRIPMPTPIQMPAVARSVDETLREESPWLARAFAATPEEVYREAACLAPRLLRRALEQAYALAVGREGRARQRKLSLRPPDMIQACLDVASESAPPRPGIGFISGPAH